MERSLADLESQVPEACNSRDRHTRLLADLASGLAGEDKDMGRQQAVHRLFQVEAFAKAIDLRPTDLVLYLRMTGTVMSRALDRVDAGEDEGMDMDTGKDRAAFQMASTFSAVCVLSRVCQRPLISMWCAQRLAFRFCIVTVAVVVVTGQPARARSSIFLARLPVATGRFALAPIPRFDDVCFQGYRSRSSLHLVKQGAGIAQDLRAVVTASP